MNKTPSSIDLLWQYQFKQALFKTSVSLLFFFTLNGLILAALTNYPITIVRPWTLFTPLFWNNPNIAIHLAWELIFLITCIQSLWSIYKNFKDFILNGYYKSIEIILKIEKNSRALHELLSIHRTMMTHIRWLFHRKTQLFYAIQLVLIAIVAILLWANSYLEAFYPNDIPFANLKNMLLHFKNLSHTTAGYQHLLTAFSLATITVILLTLILIFWGKQTSSENSNAQGIVGKFPS